MVGRCIVGGCGNTVRPGISLHRFPLGPALRRLWVSSVKTTRKDWNAPSQRSLVCSAHFKEEMRGGRILTFLLMNPSALLAREQVFVTCFVHFIS